MVLASQRTLVTIRGTGVIEDTVTLTLPVSYITLELPVFLGTQSTVTLLVDICRRVILPDSELLIRPFDTLLNRATRQTKHR